MTDYTVHKGRKAAMSTLLAEFDSIPGSTQFWNTAPEDLLTWYEGLTAGQKDTVLKGVVLLVRMLFWEHEELQQRLFYE